MKPRYLILALVAVLGVAPLVLPPYYVTLLNYIGLYTLVVLGLVLLTGVGGMTSFGQAAFVGLGAYTSAYPTSGVSSASVHFSLSGIDNEEVRVEITRTVICVDNTKA